LHETRGLTRPQCPLFPMQCLLPTDRRRPWQAVPGIRAGKRPQTPSAPQQAQHV
ncbi:Rims-Binding Protein 3B, partial [Manis pentadactyla]